VTLVWPSRALAIERVRLRGAGPEARPRLEAALDALSPASLGVPPRALLVVRRLAPSARLGRGRRGAEFGAAVAAELRSRAAQARRPAVRRPARQQQLGAVRRSGHLAERALDGDLPYHYGA